MKYENRETTTIEIGVVDYPQNDKKAFFEILCNVADAPVLAIAAETRYIGMRSHRELSKAASLVFRRSAVLEQFKVLFQPKI